MGKSALFISGTSRSKTRLMCRRGAGIRKAAVVHRLGLLAVSGFLDHYPEITPGGSRSYEEHLGR